MGQETFKTDLSAREQDVLLGADYLVEQGIPRPAAEELSQRVRNDMEVVVAMISTYHDIADPYHSVMGAHTFLAALAGYAEDRLREGSPIVGLMKLLNALSSKEI